MLGSEVIKCCPKCHKLCALWLSQYINIQCDIKVFKIQRKRCKLNLATRLLKKQMHYCVLHWITFWLFFLRTSVFGLALNLLFLLGFLLIDKKHDGFSYNKPCHRIQRLNTISDLESLNAFSIFIFILPFVSRPLLTLVNIYSTHLICQNFWKSKIWFPINIFSVYSSILHFYHFYELV